MEICFGIVNGKSSSILTELFVRHISVVSFPDNNLIKNQCICIKLVMCTDIMEIWFGLAYGQTSSIFDWVISAPHIFPVREDSFSEGRKLFLQLSCLPESVSTPRPPPPPPPPPHRHTPGKMQQNIPICPLFNCIGKD